MHSEKLKKLLLAARADERFDYVLLDSPPMLLSADAEALSALSDLSVLVVRQDYTPAGILNDCADALTQSGTDFAGFILNDFTRLYICAAFCSADGFVKIVSCS